MSSASPSRPGQLHWSTRSGRARGYATVAVVTTLMVLVTACGSGPEARSGRNDTPAGRDSAAASSKASVERYLEGTSVEPDGDVVEARPGTSVVILSCGQSIPQCKVPAEAALDAAREMGWQAQIYDGKAAISNFGPLVDQAVASGADGLMITGIACELVQAAVARAKAAGVKVANVLGADCNDAYAGQHPVSDESLYSVVKFAEYPSSRAFLEGWARATADYLIASENGRAKVLVFDDSAVPSAHDVASAQADELSKCEDCESYTVTYTPADFGQRLQGIAQQAAIKHPAANAALTDGDAAILTGVHAGLATAGRPMRSIAQGTIPAIFELLKTKQIDAVMAYSSRWLGWALADTLNSALAGKPVRNSGIGWQLVTAENDPSDADGNYRPTVDYRSAYRKLWGLS